MCLSRKVYDWNTAWICTPVVVIACMRWHYVLLSGFDYDVWMPQNHKVVFKKSSFLILRLGKNVCEDELSDCIHCSVLWRIKFSVCLELLKLPNTRVYVPQFIHSFHTREASLWAELIPFSIWKYSPLRSQWPDRVVILTLGERNENLHEFQGLSAIDVLYYPESKRLFTIYTKAFSIAEAENYSLPLSHIPALVHCQEL